MTQEVDAASRLASLADAAVPTAGTGDTYATAAPVTGIGDARAIEVLVRQYLPHVYRMLRQLGVPEGDADDAAQQVFLTLTQRLADVRIGSERAFLSATAVRI